MTELGLAVRRTSSISTHSKHEICKTTRQTNRSMLRHKYLPFIIRDCCLQKQLCPLRVIPKDAPSSRCKYSTGEIPPQGEQNAQINAEPGSQKRPDELVVREEGRMSSRLAQMTDESLGHRVPGAAKAIEEAGFSEELKRQLEERIKESTFRSENPAAFAQINMPSSAGSGTRTIAAAQPWIGDESVEDAALRMLTDAHKPLRGAGPARYPVPKGAPISVDMRMKKAVRKSQGQRLANARDRTSAYALSQDPNLSEHEKAEMRKLLQERFSSGARPMPGTVQGLAALANQQIEDAMARGQFKNIARGKGKNIERDYTASSPFLDTTEYFMNKIIQKQEIVPPWIEKQQELVKAAETFRRRLRADWKRHAARMIASKGGPLEAQIQRARAYAAAEAAINPRAMKLEAVRGIDEDGKVSPAKVPALSSSPSSAKEETCRTVISESSSLPSAPSSIPSIHPSATPIPPSSIPSPEPPTSHPEQVSLPHPFRDPAWESLELPYQTVALKSLNNLTRSYNLQAPDLAKKPYFSLARELQACFADVAPHLPDEILARARAPKAKSALDTGIIAKGGGVLERWQGSHVKVYESTKPKYGLRELWRDFWERKGGW